jgi:hypothetical protein
MRPAVKLPPSTAATTSSTANGTANGDKSDEKAVPPEDLQWIA